MEKKTMEYYVQLDLKDFICNRDLGNFMKAGTLDKYVTRVVSRMQTEVALQVQNDDEEEDLKKSTLFEAQETAGFGEPNERMCLGGLFNNIFFFQNLKGDSNSEPSGKVSTID